jgi:uncharacterized membrane protein
MRFDESLHKLLLIGLFLSVALILFGLALALFPRQSIPQSVFPLREVFPGLFTLKAGSFLSLGLLVLIATPILRVITSLISFLVEKDWRFATVTLVVFITVMISVFLGKY